MSTAAAEEAVVPRVYTNEEAARLIDPDLKVVRPSTLARLARLGLVDHTRNGRKVGWTVPQIAGAVAYLATERGGSPAPTAATRTREVPPPPKKRGDLVSLTSRPGRRYGETYS
ncbi:hypothetical protein [Herbidospora mongoliensis]|uniref:hypothetical protein n=1 Tax=Herbidospora mongoliensis TaxID=688067 RepID=UPI00082DA7AE|nr:hypothetical protein [Herbidospora mongoliensis]